MSASFPGWQSCSVVSYVCEMNEHDMCGHVLWSTDQIVRCLLLRFPSSSKRGRVGVQLISMETTASSLARS